MKKEISKQFERSTKNKGGDMEKKQKIEAQGKEMKMTPVQVNNRVTTKELREEWEKMKDINPDN